MKICILVQNFVVLYTCYSLIKFGNFIHLMWLISHDKYKWGVQERFAITEECFMCVCWFARNWKNKLKYGKEALTDWLHPQRMQYHLEVGPLWKSLQALEVLVSNIIYCNWKKSEKKVKMEETSKINQL